jgi:hypothetical protein
MGRGKINNFGQKAIDEISRSKENLISIFQGHGRGEIDQPQQCVYVFSLPTHFVDEHMGMTRDERCRSAERRC